MRCCWWRAWPLAPGTWCKASRRAVPAAWAGLSDAALEAASGVPGALFCHNGRFIAAAATREAALAMAELAVREAEKG